MDRSALKVGDFVEVQLDQDITFTATIRSKPWRVAGIDPTDSFHHPQRFCSYKQVVRVLERPAAEQVSA